MDVGSVAAGVVHQHQLPRLAFTQGEKDLLEAATDGLDDVGASSELGLTLSAIKKRWGSIFERVAAKMPDLCPSDSSDTRGIQKRNRILTYVRQHPEELRPFDEATTA
jgi:DNA-binding NarL/FixJ family response regulator